MYKLKSHYSPSQVHITQQVNTKQCLPITHYVFNGHDNLFIDNDVEIGNVARNLNSSSRCLEIENCIDEYNEIKPRP
jgi:hypothetical protein